MSKDPKQTVALWESNPKRSITATLGTKMLSGEWLSVEDAAELGASSAVLGQVRSTLRGAGYKLLERSAGAYGLKAYTVKPPYGVKQAKSQVVTDERSGKTHPQLGATLTVSALALVDGELVMSLSNGTGAWMVKVTGQVGQ